MDEETNVFNKVAFALDRNIRVVQIGVYSVAFTGLAIALRTIRPFSRFKKPGDVPKHFLESRIKLKGLVEKIEPNGALLMVQHKPLIRLGRSKCECLPVKIAGINISSNGISWLQAIVAGREVTFIPVIRRADCLDCEVSLSQKQKNKKIHTLNLGPALVQVGFGTIAPIEKSLVSNPQYLQYYRQLTAAEQTLLRKRLGLWYYAKPAQNLSLALLNKMVSFFQKRSKPMKVSTT